MEHVPREFTHKTEAMAWIAETFREWVDSLAAFEVQALADYKATGYRDINEALRLDAVEWIDDQDVIDALDSALSRFRSPESVYAFRGLVQHDPAGSLVEGTGYVDYAYVSTSLVRDVAEEFIHVEDPAEAVLARILIPGGATVGAYCGAPDLIFAAHNEAEILLPRESHFSVLQLDRDCENRWLLNLELVL